MNTEEIMKLACEMAGLKETPLDSTISVPGKNIKKVLIGIDIGTAELKIAKDLGYDLVIAHHPVSNPGYYKLFNAHVGMMIDSGVPKEVAEEAVSKRLEVLSMRNSVTNHDHVSSFAELLEIPFMNIHQPSDELGRQILQNKIDEYIVENPEATVEEIVNLLYEFPEFKYAQTDVSLRLGKLNNKAGKVKVAHGALSNGGYEVAKAYFNHGIDTLLYILIMPEDLAKLREDNVGNLIDTGHIAFDELGINPLIDKLRKQGIVVDAVSGLRYKRNHIN